MMHFVHRFEIARYFRGGFATTTSLFDRLWTCDACRTQYRRLSLFERVLPDGEDRARERLWASIKAGAAARPIRPPSRALFGGALVLAAGVAALVLVARPGPPRDAVEPVARGGAELAVGRPALHLYRSAGAARAEAVGDTVRAGDGLLVAYSNPGAELGFFMCFVVDEAGAVHWYYPAYERAGTDPAAIPIRAGAVGVELGEEIHQELPPGGVRMFALFLPRPRHVLEIEALIRRAWQAQGGLPGLTSLPVEEGSQVSRSLQVAP